MSSNPNDRIRAFRRSLDKTQREIAEQIGIKTSYYSDLENGRRVISKKFALRLKQVFGISESWLIDGKGEMYPKNVPLNVPFESTSSKKTNPYSYYEGLPEKELDFELSIEIEELRRTYEDYTKLTKAIHSINAPSFIKDKFAIPGEVKEAPYFTADFSSYRSILENDFEKDHSHIDDSKKLKVLKIIDLYQADTEHWRSQISRLIDYFYNYIDFFLDRPKLNK